MLWFPPCQKQQPANHGQRSWKQCTAFQWCFKSFFIFVHPTFLIFFIITTYFHKLHGTLISSAFHLIVYYNNVHLVVHLRGRSSYQIPWNKRKKLKVPLINQKYIWINISLYKIINHQSFSFYRLKLHLGIITFH